MTPDGAAAPVRKPRRDETLVKALVRAHRWRRRIENGQATSITDLAEQEGVTDAYICRLLPLTCLAPDAVEAMLDGRQPKGLRLAELLGNGPLDGRSSDWSGAAATPGELLERPLLQTTREDAPAGVPPVAGPDRRVVSACRHLRRYAR